MTLPFCRRATLSTLVVIFAASGCATLESGRYVAVVAVDAMGNVDPGFGEGGISLLRTGDSDHAACGLYLRGGIGVDAQRQIVTASCLGNSFVTTVRSEGGGPSPRFGTGGVVRGPRGAATELAVSRIRNTLVTGFVAVGDSTGQVGGGPSAFRVAQFDFDGADSTFGGRTGAVTTGFPGFGESSAAAVAVDADDRIVVAGSVDDGILALARYRPDGTLDSTFSGDGRTARGLPPRWNSSAVGGMGIDSLGRIVVGGHFRASAGAGGSEGHFFVTRYSANGNPDGRFGRFSITETNVPVFASAERAYDLEVLDDDRIVLCGSQPSFPFDIASLVFLLRYTADGELDPTLDGDGIVAFEWPGPRLSNCLALDILPGNAMLVTGYGSSATDTSILLSRFHADGSLDTSYGTSGAREFTSDDICAAYDCEGLDVRIDPGSLDSVVSRGLSYTTFLVLVRR